MAIPNSRQAFKEYILRRLGFPVIEINVDDEQIEDRIDDALAYFQEYHYDGLQQSFYKHQITAEDKVNQYITVPNEVISITRIVEGGGMSSAIAPLFNVNYQVALNDFFNITATSIIPYWMTIAHINLFHDIFNGTPAIKYNRKMDKVYLDTNWEYQTVGSWIVFECYVALDPETYTQVYGDRWLLRYATALVKRQWGQNMKKFQNIQLLGGQVMNGSEIYSEAEAEIEKLEAEMINSYSLPAIDIFGNG